MLERKRHFSVIPTVAETDRRERESITSCDQYNFQERKIKIDIVIKNINKIIVGIDESSGIKVKKNLNR